MRANRIGALLLSFGLLLVIAAGSARPVMAVCRHGDNSGGTLAGGTLAGGTLAGGTLGSSNDDGEITLAARLATAIGSLSLAGSWLLAEWYLDRRTRCERPAKNEAAGRAQPQAWQDEQQALQKARQDLYQHLREIANQDPRHQILLDVMDRHHDAIHRDNVWDGRQMARLHNMIARLESLRQHRHERVHSPALEALARTLNGGTTVWGSVISLDGAGGNWRPLSAAVRAAGRLEGQSGAEPAGNLSGAEIERSIQKVVSQGSTPLTTELRLLAGMFSVQDGDGQPAGRDAQSNWQTLAAPGDDPARATLDRLRGAPPAGWPNRVQRLAAIDPALADDVSLAMTRVATGLNIQSGNLLRSGERFAFSADEQIGLRLVNNHRYRQALAQGLIPRPARELANVARDKAVKNALMAAHEGLASSDPALANEIVRIDLGGSGVRPRSAQALAHWTDLELAPRGSPEAKQLLRELFYLELERLGVVVERVGVRMSTSLHPAPDNHGPLTPLGFRPASLTGHGRCVVPVDDGLLFDVHPEPAAPNRDRPENALDDARRLIVQQVTATCGQAGRLDVLRAQGKYAGRIWQHDQPRPDWIDSLDRWRADHSYRPDPAEIDHVWDAFIRFFELEEQLRDLP